MKMKNIIKFKDFIEFDFRCGEVREVKKDKLFVDINKENLIVCDKGDLKYKSGDKVIILLSDNEGRILVVSNSLLTVDKDIENGSRIS